MPEPMPHSSAPSSFGGGSTFALLEKLLHLIEEIVAAEARAEEGHHHPHDPHHPHHHKPCFVTGTRLDTPEGSVRVEAIEAGTTVSLHDGATAEVTWVGHRRATNARVIRIHPHAFGADMPRRDLLVSDDHAMLVDGVLVPAGLLVNGTTVTEETRENVTFWHVELADHAILSAEGAPAESYIDSGNRAQFGNCPLDYNPAIPGGEPCADLVLAGPRLERARAALPVAV